MNIQHGDIITLDNGDTVEVSLKVLSKKVTKLIPQHKYELKHSGNFCHMCSVRNGADYSFNPSKNPFTYIGEIDLPHGKRAIFISLKNGDSSYVMFSPLTLDFVVKEIL
jgi:hypothetical protein